jgi:hypothetical protein
MPFEAALDLSLLELLQALKEKVALEYASAWETRFPLGVTSVAALEDQVSAPQSTYLDRGSGRSDDQRFRSDASKLERTKF